jgi:hypothetical protein
LAVLTGLILVRMSPSLARVGLVLIGLASLAALLTLLLILLALLITRLLRGVVVALLLIITHG